MSEKEQLTPAQRAARVGLTFWATDPSCGTFLSKNGQRLLAGDALVTEVDRIDAATQDKPSGE